MVGSPSRNDSSGKPSGGRDNPDAIQPDARKPDKIAGEDQPDPEGMILIDIPAGDREIGKRLDRVVSEHVPALSRSAAARLIRDGRIRVDDRPAKPGNRIRPGERITGGITARYPENTDTAPPEPEAVELDILHEDDSIIVINKAAGMVIHPAPGHSAGTLVHGLCHHIPGIGHVGPSDRPGIVHRLDRDTSGVLVAAKTESAHRILSEQFKSRKIRKSYLAFVLGDPAAGGPGAREGRITYRIERHRTHRKKMAVTQDPESGRDAETAWELVEKYDGICLLRLAIKTGRTHQIRVHLAAAGHPVAGDSVYGYRNPARAAGLSHKTAALINNLRRQMLHAASITFAHPETGKQMTCKAPLPDDMQALRRALHAMNAPPE